MKRQTFRRNTLISVQNKTLLREMFFSVSDTGGLEEKIRVLPIGVEPLITCPHPLPLSYRRLGDSKPYCYRNLFRSPAVMLFQLVSLICLTL